MATARAGGLVDDEDVEAEFAETVGFHFYLYFVSRKNGKRVDAVWSIRFSFIKNFPNGKINFLTSCANFAVIVIFIVVVASLMSIRKVLVLEPAVVFRG